MKRLNPYSRLLKEIKQYIRDIKYRHRRVMWAYPVKRLNEGWDLSGLYQRVSAAEQLGYEVKLETTKESLNVVYHKKIPDNDFEWR